MPTTAVGAPRVLLPDGTIATVRQVVSDGADNAKQAKSMLAIDGFLVVNVSLAPAGVAGVGNLCPKSTAGCRNGCIFTAGNGRYDSTQRARVARTVLYRRDRDTFRAMLRRDLKRHLATAEFLRVALACRLNNFSDIPWERRDPDLFAEFPTVRFYDYTKIPARLGKTPANYHLTLPQSEDNDRDCLAALRRGFNVAVAFDRALPAQWHGHPVIDGDRHDYRFLDPSPVAVGLRAKGRGRSDRTGFVVRP